jgi:hypothetical protein
LCLRFLSSWTISGACYGAFLAASLEKAMSTEALNLPPQTTLQKGEGKCSERSCPTRGLEGQINSISSG